MSMCHDTRIIRLGEPHPLPEENYSLANVLSGARYQERQANRK
jgi:hypothetical protein